MQLLTISHYAGGHDEDEETNFFVHDLVSVQQPNAYDFIALSFATIFSVEYVKLLLLQNRKYRYTADKTSLIQTILA